MSRTKNTPAPPSRAAKQAKKPAAVSQSMPAAPVTETPGPAGTVPRRRKSAANPAIANEKTKPSATPARPSRKKADTVAAAQPVPLTPAASMPLADATAPGTSGKQASVLAALRRPEGASIGELMAITGWLSHSVRGLLSAVVKRKLGLALASSVDAERGRVYRTEPAARADANAKLPKAMPLVAGASGRRVLRVATPAAASASAAAPARRGRPPRAPVAAR